MYQYKHKSNCIDCRNIVRYDDNDDLEKEGYIKVENGLICNDCKIERNLQQSIVTYNYIPTSYSRNKPNYIAVR